MTKGWFAEVVADAEAAMKELPEWLTSQHPTVIKSRQVSAQAKTSSPEQEQQPKRSDEK